MEENNLPEEIELRKWVEGLQIQAQRWELQTGFAGMKMVLLLSLSLSNYKEDKGK